MKVRYARMGTLAQNKAERQSSFISFTGTKKMSKEKKKKGNRGKKGVGEKTCISHLLVAVSS